MRGKNKKIKWLKKKRKKKTRPKSMKDLHKSLVPEGQKL
jgi:hypothetical protein